MAELSARVLFGGRAHTVGNGTDYKQSPVGIFFGTQQAEPFTLPDDAIVWYDPGSGSISDTLAQGTQATIWGGSTVLLNNLTTDYVLFSTPGSGALYAARQQDYPAIMSATTVIPLWDLRGRTWKRRQLHPIITVLGTVGWSGGSFSQFPSNNYATSTHGDWGLVMTPVYHFGSAWFLSPPITMGARRVAISELGHVLVAVNDGTLWYLDTPDTVPGVQIAFASGVYTWVNNVHYNFTTKTWWLLAENIVYASRAESPLAPDDWTVAVNWTSYSDTGSFIGMGPNGDVLLNWNPPRASHWSYGYLAGGLGGTVTVVDLPPAANTDLDSFFTAGEPGQTLFGVDNAVLADPEQFEIGILIDTRGGYDNTINFEIACDDGVGDGGAYALTVFHDLLHRVGPQSLGNPWDTLVLAVDLQVGRGQLLQLSPRTAHTLTIVSQYDFGGPFGQTRSRLTQVDTISATVTHGAPFNFIAGSFGSEAEAIVMAAASNL